MSKREHRIIDIVSDDTILRTFVLFIQTARAVQKYADTYLYTKARFSVVKLIVLQALAINNGVMKPSEIAEWTQTERHNITALVDRLRREGLIKIERKTSDKRTVNIIMTEKGREILSQVMPVAQEVIDQVMLSIAEGDAVLLEKLLKVLRQNAVRGLEQLAKRSQ
jgi:DNA-binding MarR family transcriptional regulator